MIASLTRILLTLSSLFEAYGAREAEILVLRQQLLVLSRKSPKRVRLRNIDRLILVWLSRLFPSVLDAMVKVKPETVLPGIDVGSALTGAGSRGGVAVDLGSIVNSVS